MRGTTDKTTIGKRRGIISIHVPLAGDDLRVVSQFFDVADISIHVPLAGDDKRPKSRPARPIYFYPRPPCGGRRGKLTGGAHVMYFYPRPPCGGRLTKPRPCGRGLAISIHVPLAGDDMPSQSWTPGQRHFYPRPPCGGRRQVQRQRQRGRAFLSTSPLRGTTTRLFFRWLDSFHFYPRPPCGGRP